MPRKLNEKYHRKQRGQDKGRRRDFEKRTCHPARKMQE